jgi:hypothetical protein
VLTDLVRAGKVRAFGSSTTPASDIVEAQWVAERRGLARFRTEQPPYSILNRGIEREVLPVAERFGMGTLVWGPFGQGLLTGRVRKGQENPLRRTRFSKHLTDERRIDVVEQPIPLAAEAGMPMTHLAMAFTIAHPGVTSALLGPRTMEHLDDLLAGVDVVLTDDLLDRIDAIVPPGTDVTALDQDYVPPPFRTPTCAGDRCANARPPERGDGNVVRNAERGTLLLYRGRAGDGMVHLRAARPERFRADRLGSDSRRARADPDTQGPGSVWAAHPCRSRRANPGSSPSETSVPAR